MSAANDDTARAGGSKRAGKTLRPPDQHRRVLVVKTLWPPQAGTIRLGQQHGDALLCVRYRRDAQRLTRLTTVELIVSEERIDFASCGRRRFWVRLDPAEHALQAALIGRGGRREASAGGQELWRASGSAIADLKLQDRVQPGA